MNNWAQMMGMGQQYQPQMMPNMMGGPGGVLGGQPPLPGGTKPLMPPPFMVPEIGLDINPAPPVDPPLPLIGPVLPDNMNTEDMTMSDDEKEKAPASSSVPKENKDDNKNANSRERDNRNRENRDRDRGRNDRRSRERDRPGARHDRNDRHNDRNKDRFNDRNRDRNDRNERSRDRDRRERKSKWGDSDDISDTSGMPAMPGMPGSGMIMPGMGGMMPGVQGMGPGGPGIGGMGMQGMGSGGMGMQGMGSGGMGMQGMGPSGMGMQGMGTGGSGMGGMGAGGTGVGGMGLGGQGMGPGNQMMNPDEQSMGRMGHGAQGMGGMPGGQGMGSGGSGMGQGNYQPYGMQNMPNTGNMQNMQMMPGMNNMMMNMNNMMDSNMVMMNGQMIMPNQPIYLSDGGVLLPPALNSSMPNRREKPPGCRTIFVGGLPKSVSEETIGEIFQAFGVIADIKVHRQGVCHVRFDKHESVEASFFISGYRFKTHDQTKNEATTLFVDYALNRDDQNEFERNQRQRPKTPPRIEPFNPTTLTTIGEKIKNDEEFIEAAPTLVAWLERGECNKRNANTFYSLVQASNNQVRRLFNDKMSLDEQYHTMKSSLREKFSKVVEQFEAVAKILAVAKHQRVSDHFTKQQRRNIEMWLKMTEEVTNIKEEFNAMFDDEETEKCGRHVVPAEKYEKLRMDHENLVYELEGYKNEAHLAKDEAERKFEKFKAHWIAQQALQNNGQPQAVYNEAHLAKDEAERKFEKFKAQWIAQQASQNKGQPQVFPPLPPPPLPNMAAVPPMTSSKPQPPPPTPDDDKVQTTGPAVPPSEAKLISILTAFLMVHPLGASLDYLVSYVRSMVPNVTQATVHQTLQKYGDVFARQTSGIGANIEHRWGFNTFDIIKNEIH